MKLDPSQIEAIDMVERESICIVTGGPGTGKSTILREALSRCRANHESFVLCAPTGKAAKRMTETTGVEAKTIHRALGFNPETGWTRDEYNPLEESVVFVDEASMIDVEIFARLLAAIRPGITRLVLLGDSNQLPSVGPGFILGDLVSMDLVPCKVLTKVHRSAAGSWICRNAPKILKGDDLELATLPDFRFVYAEESAEVKVRCAEILRNTDAQILVPQKTGAAGTQAINEHIQEEMNPLRPGEIEWGKAPDLLRPRDRVIHTRNNYDLGVFNGEVGVVESVGNETLSVSFPDRSMPVVYTKPDAFDLKLAYALTIHKSQGSEWPWAIVVAHSTHHFMLTKRLLYTAITRGKQGVVIVGNEKGIKAATKSKKDSTRNTALGDRIRGKI